MPASQQRVFLHVGVPKSGTTYLQAVLWHNRSAAAAQGVLYPGYVAPAQFHAALDLQPERYGPWLRPMMRGAWGRLVEQVLAWPETSVISSELLSSARPAEVRRARTDLAAAEVHIVCTVRDLARQIPSAWQENVKTRQSMTFPEFLAAVRSDGPTPAGEEFWSFQDAVRVLRVWAEDLPPERVHVVTVPPPDGPADLLWQRFAGVLGLDPGSLDTEVPNPNRSLGLAEAELLRRLNVALPAELPWPRYESLIKEQIAEDILPGRRAGTRITLPEPDRPWVRERAAELAGQLHRAGYHVVGDLAELVPPAEAGTRPPAEPSDAELLRVAVDLMAELVPMLPERPIKGGPTERVRQALLDLSEQCAPVMGLRRIYWKGRQGAQRVRDRH